MNGTRMNQLVAPTSFMTATSRRRAKMASWMVLTIRATAPDHHADGEDVPDAAAAG